MMKDVYLLRDNTPAPKSRVAMNTTLGLFKLLPHPLYSSDLSMSDYHLFPHMKRQLHGRVFTDDDEMKPAVMEVLEGFSTDLFGEGLEALAKPSQKCVSVTGDYVENNFFLLYTSMSHLFSFTVRLWTF